MACLLIVDDDVDNARQLADVIAAGLPDAHDIVWINGLADFRQFRQRYKPDLILVELLRYHSNGFTQAAAFARLSSAPVVLLTDRDLASDHLWAAARGIRHLMSRRGGPTVLLQQIQQLLTDGFCQSDAVVTNDRCKPAVLSKSQLDELMTAPEAALLRCIRDELRRLPHKPAPLRAEMAAKNNAAQLRWLQNLLCYITDGKLRNALMLSIMRAEPQPVQPQAEPAADVMLHVRESLLALIEPDAGSTLQAHCKEAWLQICQTLQAGLPASGRALDGSTHDSLLLESTSILPHCMDLLDALVFVPEFKEVVSAVRHDPGLTVPDFAELIHRLVGTRLVGSRLVGSKEESEELRNLIAPGCLRALRSPTAWSDLAGLCLMLRATAVKQRWQPILDACMKGMYGWKNGQQKSDSEQVICLILSLLNNVPMAPEIAHGAEPSLSAGVAQKLRSALDEVAAELSRQVPLYKRISFLMVSLYKLRGWLELSASGPAVRNKALQHWQLAIGCLYELFCHGVLQAGLLTRSDINDLNRSVTELQRCLGQGLLPAENTLMNLVALEITVRRRSQCSYGQEHHLLAAGLHRLPKPDCLLADMVDDIEHCGTVLSEITHELRVLAEGARRLGVGRAESLATLMLDCYQQLNSQPELLQRKTLRLALGRAHRVLCRLLDQAAAWLPLDQSGAGLSVPAVIDDLFTQFDHSGRKACGADAGSRQTAWVQCQSLNRRLRQLVRRSGNLAEYRSLIAELLQEQQAVITPYLSYQSTE
ncbi:MAG: response regulator [Pseudohongiella sp.]|nr:response regulator [Pseudohongiella sp.]